MRRSGIGKLMRPKFQKRSALKLAGRIIPRSGGYNTTQLAAESVSKACFGVHTRDKNILYTSSHLFSVCLMYFTRIDPFAGKKIFVEKKNIAKKQKQKDIVVGEN